MDGDLIHFVWLSLHRLECGEGLAELNILCCCECQMNVLLGGGGGGVVEKGRKDRKEGEGWEERKKEEGHRTGGGRRWEGIKGEQRLTSLLKEEETRKVIECKHMPQ